MTQPEIIAPRSLLARASKHYSGETLDMHNPARSKGQVFSWNGKYWTCTGVVWNREPVSVYIREVVLADKYDGPPNNPAARGDDFYLGGQFTANRQTWVMTGNRVILKPAEDSEFREPEQLNLFK